MYMSLLWMHIKDLSSFELHFNLTRYNYLSFIFREQVLITPKVQADLDKGNVSGLIPDNILVEFL